MTQMTNDSWNGVVDPDCNEVKLYDRSPNAVGFVQNSKTTPFQEKYRFDDLPDNGALRSFT